MSSQQHIIIVGAGIIGASIAWHLTRRGLAVTVVSERIGGVATPSSFAWINASWGNPEFYFHFRRYAMAEWRRLETELPDLSVNWCGGICWDLPLRQLEAYAAEHGRWGYGIERIGPAEIAAQEPYLAQPPEFALRVDEEGAVEPVAAAHVMLADAEARGAKLLSGIRVSRVIQRGSQITGIITQEGELRADCVVLASGTGAASLAESAGIKLPLEAPPGLIVHSRPYKSRLRGLVIAPELHMRQTAEGRIIAGGDFGGSEPGEDRQATANALFTKAKAMLLDVNDLTLDFFSVGYRPTPIDGFPIVGKSENHNGLYIAVTHSGVTLAPAVGLLAASEITSGECNERLAPFRLSRFG